MFESCWGHFLFPQQESKGAAEPFSKEARPHGSADILRGGGWPTEGEWLNTLQCKVMKPFMSRRRRVILGAFPPTKETSNL